MTITPKPVSYNGDPDTPLVIRCSWCGKSISFEAYEVFVNGSSYVCYDHAFNDCRNCRFSVRHPKMGFWLCQHPSLPCMKMEPKDCESGLPGANAAEVSGRKPGAGCGLDPAPCAGYKLFERRDEYNSPK